MSSTAVDRVGDGEQFSLNRSMKRRLLLGTGSGSNSAVGKDSRHDHLGKEVTGSAANKEVRHMERERDDMRKLLNTLEMRGMEIQGHVRILSQERDHLSTLYEESRSELQRVREELVTCDESYARSYSSLQHLLHCAEQDRDTALAEVHRLTAECTRLNQQTLMSQDQCSEATRAVESLRTHNEQLRRENEDLRQTVDQGQVTKTLLHEQMDNIAREAKANRDDLVHIQQQFTRQQGQYEELMIAYEKRGCEEEELSASLSRLHEENNHLQEQLKEKTYQWSHLREALFEKERIVEQLKQQLLQSDSKLEAYEQRLETLSSESNQLKNDLAHLYRKIRGLDDELTHSLAERKSLREAHQEHLAEIRHLSTNLEKKSDDLAQIVEKYALLQEHSTDRETRLCAAESELAGLRIQLNNTEKDLVDTKGALRGAEEENWNYRSSLQTAHDQIDALQLSKDELSTRLHVMHTDREELLRALQDLRNVCAQQETTRTELLSEVRNKEMEVERIISEVNELHENMNLLREQLIREEDNRRSLQTVLDSSREREMIAVSDAQSMANQIQTLQATVESLSEALDSARRQVDSLQERNHLLEVDLQRVERNYSNEKFEKLQLQSELRIQSLVPSGQTNKDPSAKDSSYRGFT